MKRYLLSCFVLFFWTGFSAFAAPLGLPKVPIPPDNAQTQEKIKLGDKLFHEKRFSSTGEVACGNCHVREKVFTDGLKVSEGIRKLTGTRNAPTVVNAAYFTSLFWDGREPSLERQATQPFLNPVEMNLPNHDPILKIVRRDPEYAQAFKKVFGKAGEAITIKEVTQAIAAFERTLISGESPFDRWFFGGEKNAISPDAKRGFQVFLTQGRCVSCHTLEQDHALFTDSKFHNIGVGFTKIAKDVDEMAVTYLRAGQKGESVDIKVLTNQNVSELGRFAVTRKISDLGAFKTSTLRNIAKTAPYMHDGSLETLEEVVDFYNNGGKVDEDDPEVPFLSGGIRPLDLSDEQKADLEAFLKALTSPNYQ